MFRRKQLLIIGYIEQGENKGVFHNTVFCHPLFVSEDDLHTHVMCVLNADRIEIMQIIKMEKGESISSYQAEIDNCKNQIFNYLDNTQFA